MATYKNFYSKQGLWTLFLMTALPLHIWTIVLAFRDFDWISARTNSWDAIGVVAYGLIAAILESLLLFIVVTLFGFLISNKWEEKRRITFMSAMIIILSLWSIFNQSYFLNEWELPVWLTQLIIQTGRPLVMLYILGILITIASFSIPAYLILNSNKTMQILQEVIDRLSLLMMLYLVFDAAALIMIVIRNF
ncbi:MAG: hypothetical protein J0L96_14500 [Anaerolineae bacterium]|nr:hypothetical protein [Anaerolineae bacterium]